MGESALSTGVTCVKNKSTTPLWLAIRHGDREQDIGRLRVGLLRHADILARRRLVVTLTACRRAAGFLAVEAPRFVVLVERVVELQGRPLGALAPRRGAVPDLGIVVVAALDEARESCGRCRRRSPPTTG